MRKFLALLPLLFLAACAYTKVESQRLPAAAAQQPFQSLFVFGAAMYLGQVKDFEKSMGDELALMGVSAQFGTAYLPYDASPEDVFAKAGELPVEGLLIVTQESFEVIPTYTPGYWVPPTEKAPGYYVPPITGEENRGRFSATLYNLRIKGKSEKIWLADIESTSSSYGGKREIFRDVGVKVARKLADDGLITDNRRKK
jgi:hypothetical protein